MHVDLIPSTKHASLQLSSAADSESDDFRHSSSSYDGGSKRERRHQIPGLRQTPYLKIYLLQCDDIDAYRASVRQKLREWVNAQYPVSQNSASKNKQENHDAFEWLIIHVERDRPDSSRPASTKSDPEVRTKASTSRWKSRGAKSVLEKLRSDFNGTSKSTIDRVVQVDILSTPPGANQPDQSLQDENAGWVDLVGKMKSLILSSFDLRVQQYEDDIKEKELQRSLPGWNFNTFFVLKEGLARGFESVGLVEDALTGYRELAAGLNAVVDEQLASESSAQQSSRFQNCTDDIQRAINQALKLVQRQSTSSDDVPTKISDLGSSVLDTERKPFRNLILENNISVFDFQCYVFARQMALLLRLANAELSDKASTGSPLSSIGFPVNPRSSSKLNGADSEDHLLLADVCQLALDFLASSSWTIRRDIEATLDEIFKSNTEEEATVSVPTRQDIVNNLVASWTFSVSAYVLEVTSTNSLLRRLGAHLRQLRRSNKVQFNIIKDSGDEDEGNPPSIHFPHRTSSLSFRSPSITPTSTEHVPAAAASTGASEDPFKSPIYPGTCELAGLRGDILSLARRTLDSLVARLTAWHVGFDGAATRNIRDGPNMQDVDLNGNYSHSRKQFDKNRTPEVAAFCITNRTLSVAIQSKDSFFAIYEVSILVLTLLKISNGVVVRISLRQHWFIILSLKETRWWMR